MGASDVKVNYDKDELAFIADFERDSLESLPTRENLESENARLQEQIRRSDEMIGKLTETIQRQSDEIGVLMGMYTSFQKEIHSISASTDAMAEEHERTFVEFKQSVFAQLMPGMLKLREQTINPMHWDSMNEIKNISIGMDETVFSETISGVVSVFQKDLDELIATANRILE